MNKQENEGSLKKYVTSCGQGQPAGKRERTEDSWLGVNKDQLEEEVDDATVNAIYASFASEVK